MCSIIVIIIFIISEWVIVAIITISTTMLVASVFVIVTVAATSYVPSAGSITNYSYCYHY